jgi:hypothetical protein
VLGKFGVSSVCGPSAEKRRKSQGENQKEPKERKEKRNLPPGMVIEASEGSVAQATKQKRTERRRQYIDGAGGRGL